MGSDLDFEGLQRDADHHRLNFLRHEIEMANTFCDVAETELRIGDRENAARSIADATKGYETANRFLTDPKHGGRVPENERRKMAQDLARLRERIDGFKI